MAVLNFIQARFVNGRNGSERPHGFDKTPLEIGGKQVVLPYTPRCGGVDKYDLVLSAHVGNNAGMGYITFLTGLRDKKQPVAGLDFLDLADFLPELGLLPRYAGYLNAHFGIYLTDQAGAVDTLFVIASGAVGGAGISAGDLDDLRDIGSICRAGPRVSGGSGSGGLAGRCL